MLDEIEQNTQTEYEHKENELENTPVSEKMKIEIIDEDQELDLVPMGIFMNKSELLGKTIVIKPLQLSKGKFGFNLKFSIEGDTVNTWLIDLNKTNYNWFVTTLGKKVSEWKNYTLTLSGESFSGVNKRTGEPMQGISLVFKQYTE